MTAGRDDALARLRAAKAELTAAEAALSLMTTGGLLRRAKAELAELQAVLNALQARLDEMAQRK